MSSQHDSAVRQHQTVPPGLPFTMKTAHWPMAFRLFVFPVTFVVLPVWVWIQRAEAPRPGTMMANLFILGAMSLALALGLLWLRRGPDFGVDVTGVWLRPSIWSRRARFVPWDRLDLIVIDRKHDREITTGIQLGLRTPDGPVPSRPRFVPCRESGYRALAAELSRHDCEVQDFPEPLGYLQRRDPVTGAPVMSYRRVAVMLLGAVLVFALSIGLPLLASRG